MFTGTVLSGSIAVNDTVDIPAVKVCDACQMTSPLTPLQGSKKVKSMQMFHTPVSSITQVACVDHNSMRG